MTLPLIEAGKCDAMKAVSGYNETAWEECIARVEAMKAANPSVMTWIKDNVWTLGIFFLIIGPMIALFGKRCYPYIAALIGFIVVIPVVVFLCSGQGWLDTTAGFWISVSVALLAGGLVAFILYRSVWVGVTLITAYAGSIVGFFIYGALLQTTGWHSKLGAVLL